ncbi:MAG: class I SAM-dependent methyltransferase [Planctomycetaceae bacterium]
MKSQIKKIEWVSRLVQSRALRVHEASFARSTGWFESARTGTSVDSNDDPIPWITYSALHFLKGRIRTDLKVFEFGSGNSTLWWAAKVQKVVSCEHDPVWHELVRHRIPQNVKYLLRSLDDESYSRAILEEDDAFDVVVIDGRRRNECLISAMQRLNEEGVVIWDNSDRARYVESFDLLANHGFRRIEFRGMGPVGIAEWETSVFYRSSNCLDI